MIGRAAYWKSDDDPSLPNDLKLVGEYPNPARGVTLVIVEGERLPGWTRGARPWEFQSQAEMLDFRRGTHL